MQTRLGWIAFALLLLAAPGPAAGVTFFANVLNDRADPTPGDGSCDVDPDTAGDQCSLRSAVQTANETPEGDLINLAPFGNGSPGPFTYTLSIAPTAGTDDAASGDLDVTSPMEISSDVFDGGPDATFVDAKKLKDRIFDVKPGGELTLRRMTLRNGKTAKDDVDPGSPGEVSGGCLRSEGAVTLARVFQYRCASSDDGGCMSVIGGTATVTDSIFSTCSAKDEGGALEVRALGAASLARSTAAACRAATGGGIATHGDLTLQNMTVDGNRAKVGGGIALLGAGTSHIESTTISSSKPTNLDASQNTGVATVANTIVWGAKTDCVGSVSSAGGNLEGATSCGFTATNDQQSQDPLLAPLNFYGGFPLTRTLAGPIPATPTDPGSPGSPAIDHGIDGANCSISDARGVTRVDVPGVGVAICDSGAVEYNFTAPVP